MDSEGWTTEICGPNTEFARSNTAMCERNTDIGRPITGHLQRTNSTNADVCGSNKSVRSGPKIKVSRLNTDLGGPNANACEPNTEECNSNAGESSLRNTGRPPISCSNINVGGSSCNTEVRSLSTAECEVTSNACGSNTVSGNGDGRGIRNTDVLSPITDVDILVHNTDVRTVSTDVAGTISNGTFMTETTHTHGPMGGLVGQLQIMPTAGVNSVSAIHPVGLNSYGDMGSTNTDMPPRYEDIFHTAPHTGQPPRTRSKRLSHCPRNVVRWGVVFIVVSMAVGLMCAVFLYED